MVALVRAPSRVVLALALLLAGPVLPRREAAATAASAAIAPLLTTTFNDLGTPPLSVTVTRVVFTPGASDAEALPGPRLVLVESGRLTLSSAVAIAVTHSTLQAAPGAPTATATPTRGPTPTPVGSSTPDQFLAPGDTYPVPFQTMTALRNDGTTPAVILDVRIASGATPRPPANLDVETLASATGLVTLPTGPAAVSLGRGRLDPGAGVAAPATGEYRLVAAVGGGAAKLVPQPDGSVANTGTAALAVYVLSIAAAVAAVPKPPTQPATGPGGAAVAYDRVVVAHKGGQPGGYWLFEPADPHGGGATPAARVPLPVALFFAGACCDETALGGDDPAPYRAWIDHVVRRGTVVVVPTFQVKTALNDAVTAVRAALADLGGGTHPPTDPARLLAFGHSYGGVLAVNYAAVAAKERLPVPIALMPTTPGCGCLLADLSAIPATTRLVVVVGSDDNFVGETDAKRIWAELPQIPADRKDYVRLMSDFHGQPALFADHPMPATSDWGPLDALDWYGTWKLFDALVACAVAGQGCATSFGDTPAERFMGTWSDGVPVTEAQVVKDPGPPPTTATPTA